MFKEWSRFDISVYSRVSRFTESLNLMHGHRCYKITQMHSCSKGSSGQLAILTCLKTIWSYIVSFCLLQIVHSIYSMLHGWLRLVENWLLSLVYILLYFGQTLISTQPNQKIYTSNAGHERMFLGREGWDYSQSNTHYISLLWMCCNPSYFNRHQVTYFINTV